MTPPTTKLFGPKGFVLAVGAMLVGTGFFLFRRHHELGHLEATDLIAAVVTIVAATIIMVVVARKANRED